MADEDKGIKPLKDKKKAHSSVDTEPKLKTQNGENGKKLMEHIGMNKTTGWPMSTTDYFIRLGLGDRNFLNFYRKAIMDPIGSNQNPQYRMYVADIAYQLLVMIINDTQLMNRLRTLLQEGKGMSEAAEKSLRKKAADSGLEFSTLLEVYLRGYDVNENSDEAFNRVNSFIANGRAAEMDHDLKPRISFSQLQSLMKKKV